MKHSIFIILAVIFASSCSESKNSNYLDSDEFETIAERIEALKNEIKPLGEFNDAELELYNVNGFSNSRGDSIPAPSYSDYKLGIKVGISAIDKWTKGMIKSEPNGQNLA